METLLRAKGSSTVNCQDKSKPGHLVGSHAHQEALSLEVRFLFRGVLVYMPLDIHSLL